MPAHTRTRIISNTAAIARALTIGIGLVAAGRPAVAAGPYTKVFGDVDANGRVGRSDAIEAMRHWLGFRDRKAARVRADVAPWTGGDSPYHGDGMVDLRDAVTILTLAGDSRAYRRMAEAAVSDLLGHFWVGGAADGHILPTRDGYAHDNEGSGMLWERAQLLCVLENLYQATGDPALRRRLASDWAFQKDRFGLERLKTVGEGSANGWSDDAGWSALMDLAFYRSLGDTDALGCAEGLFRNAVERWTDPSMGGLWYRDNHREKAVYQASLILAGVRLYELTGDRAYWDLALPLYQWVEKTLARPDGLYYVEADRNGPRRNDHAPLQGSSDTFLGGNMAMGVIQARLYRDTGDDAYRRLAIRTANAILAVETQPDGVYLNDRDAWTEGFFMGDWAAEVLTLPGIGPEHAQILRQSALSIATGARTPDGYYSPCWSGPALGEGCTWYQSPANVRPQQLTTSANSVNVIVAAAALGVRRPAPARKAP